MSTLKPALFKPIAAPLKGKGLRKTVKRSVELISRYGLSTGKMDRAISHFLGISEQYNFKLTLSVTAAALARSPQLFKNHTWGNLELNIHGCYHVDHRRLPAEIQDQYLKQAKEIFTNLGIPVAGFRCPYLRWNEDTLEAIKNSGLLYDSSQGLYWDDIGIRANGGYNKALNFYHAIAASECASLPFVENDLVRFPYSLPDDEALIDRLFYTQSSWGNNNPWQHILSQTYEKGELFVLGLHPERIYACEKPLIDAVESARSYSPGVWIANLDEIAHWWIARKNTKIHVIPQHDGWQQLTFEGPAGSILLSKNMSSTRNQLSAWDGAYQIVSGKEFWFQTGKRPFIGISQQSSPALPSFLTQQGYIVEISSYPNEYDHYLDMPEFKKADERSILRQIETAEFPLLRFGRWPDGYKSALAITGDIDALTLWDYGLRLFGK